MYQDPAMPPSEYRTLDTMRAYEQGYRAGSRKAPRRYPSSMNRATTLVREAWARGFDNGAAVAAMPDPFPAITREERRITEKYMRPKKRATSTPAECHATWRRGFEAGKAGQARLYGAHEKSLVTIWCEGYDAGARLAANLRRIHR